MFSGVGMIILVWLFRSSQKSNIDCFIFTRDLRSSVALQLHTMSDSKGCFGSAFFRGRKNSRFDVVRFSCRVVFEDVLFFEEN